MSLLSRLFGKKAGPAPPPDPASSDLQAVLVHLDGVNLPDHVYQENDLATIESQVTEALSRLGLGICDGNEMGPTESTLFLYGPDAEKLFAGIESVLRANPLCQGARVVLRQGGPGSPEREIKL